MSGMKLKYVSSSHRSSNNNPILREKMPENDLNQPFDDFFYEKLKAPDGNSATKNKSMNSVNQEIPNEVSKTITLPIQPPSKNKTPFTTARIKSKPISSSLKCNLGNGNSKSKSTISSSSSKSSSGKTNASRKSWTTSTHSESLSSKRQTPSSKQKLPETTKKIVSLNDSDDCDNDDEDYDNSVEDDDDFVEGNYFLNLSLSLKQRDFDPTIGDPNSRL